jgi:hypothetical protein
MTAFTTRRATGAPLPQDKVDLLVEIANMREALERLGPAPPAELRLHPNDVVALRHGYGAALVPPGALAAVRIIEDPDAPLLPRTPT